jgi:hypothetical protein
MLAFAENAGKANATIAESLMPVPKQFNPAV